MIRRIARYTERCWQKGQEKADKRVAWCRKKFSQEENTSKDVRDEWLDRVALRSGTNRVRINPQVPQFET